MHHPHALTWLVYWIGWLVFVLGQAHNSIASRTNALSGWAGLKLWLRAQAANLLTRAFFAAIFAGYIIQQVAEKLESVNLPLHTLGIEALSGFAANALLYQVLGLVPWLRVEVSDLAPPTLPPPPTSPTLPTLPTPGAKTP